MDSLASRCAIVTLTPLAASYVGHPARFPVGTDRVITSRTGSVDAERPLTDLKSIGYPAHYIQRAAFVPSHGPSSNYDVTDPPLVGWPLPVPTAIGLVMVAVGFQRRYIGIAVAYRAAMLD